MRMLNAEKILSVGKHDVQAREDWWYPLYVKEACPGLPGWQALNACAKLFRAEGEALSQDEKGTFYVGDWDNDDPELIRSLSLNFRIERVADAKTLWDILLRYAKDQKPIVLLNWSPNWTDKVLPGEFVNFPEYHPLCESEPAWGSNKEMTHDCGNRKQVAISKIVWPGIKDAYPCVAEFIANVNLLPEMMVDASFWVLVDKLSEQDAAKRWRQKYNKQIARWLSGSCLSQ